jgi:uncharacterized protein with PQ loop repeat
MAMTSATLSQLVAAAATVYGVLAALSVLLQAREMLARRASCEVSGRFFALYAGGHAIWLFYGLSVANLPLIVVDAIGLLCGALTLAVTLSLRGSLIHPTTWTSCSRDPTSAARSEGHPESTAAREKLGADCAGIVLEQKPSSRRYPRLRREWQALGRGAATWHSCLTVQGRH